MWHDQSAGLRGTGNAHRSERVDDLIDLERQVRGVLTGAPVEADAIAPGAILVADDLLPSQLVTLAASRPAGVCLAHGGPTSHVAILCAGMGIPALVAMGTALDAVAAGEGLLLDRSEARSGGKEWFSTVGFRWCPSHYKKKN